MQGKVRNIVFGEFQKELLEFREEEKNIAGRAGKLALHLQKWEQVKFS